MLPPLPETSNPFRPQQLPLGVGVRTVLMLAGLTAIGLLATAALLTPNERGLGTHQQLGLPPCSLRVLAGVRCPSCGMTTSWSHLMRGQIASSFASNSGGALLGLLTILIGPWCLASGIRGRWLGGLPNEWTFAWCSIGIMIVTLIDWGVRLYLGYRN